MQFANDRQMYPDADVHMRGHRCGGIPKIILEEYEALGGLASHLRCVRGARLTQASTEGRDAEIRFWLGRRIDVEITCASESDDVARQRKQLASGQPIFSFERIHPGRGLSCTEAVVVERIERIRKRIEEKSANYRGNAEILLIADESADWEHLKQSDFIGRVREMFPILNNVPYKRVYVCFGDTVVSA